MGYTDLRHDLCVQNLCVCNTKITKIILILVLPANKNTIYYIAEGGMDGARDGGREGGKEGGMEGRREGNVYLAKYTYIISWHLQ